MNCCKCKRDVKGLPVIRDNVTGLVCCETCGTMLGGPSGFIKYVESYMKQQTNNTQNPEGYAQKEILKKATLLEITLGVFKFIAIVIIAFAPLVLIVLFLKSCGPH